VVVWLEECQQATQHFTRAWDLDSLLIKPVQRIARYLILISEILGNTTEDHPDYRDLIEAKELLVMSLLKINAKKEDPQPKLLITTDDDNAVGITPSRGAYS
jgi:hypothetical protein